MERELTRLTKQVFDLAIIGGGINGAATAREAALRGLKVALVEARDFASGTSSRSSKLIHGGLRYLDQFAFGLVRESRLERRLLHQIAPHLSRTLPFLLPIYHGDPYYPLKIHAGLTLYDLLGNLGREDRHRMLSREETLQVISALRPDGLRAGAVYFDSETDDARLTLEYILDAAQHSTVVANYTEVRKFECGPAPGRNSSEVIAAEVFDSFAGRSYEMRARFWVNAAGPWVDRVRALVPGFDGKSTIRLTRGTHLILPQVNHTHALFAAIPPGDRVFLLLPWNGFSLLGTTDTDFDGDPASVRPDAEDAEYLLRAVNRVLQKPFAPNDVLGCFAGLRALVIEPGRSPSENTRESRVHSEPSVKNFISICGGKLTTARALGVSVVKAVLGRLGLNPKQRHDTRYEPLPGAFAGPSEVFFRHAGEEAAREYQLLPQVADRVVRTYGSRWRQVLEPIRERKSLAEVLPGSPPLLRAEVEFAIRQEMAMTVEDFFLRRSGVNWLAPCTLREAVSDVALIFAEHLGWSAAQQREAVEDFLRNTSVQARND